MKYIILHLFILFCLLFIGCKQEKSGESFSLTVTIDTDSKNKLYLFYKGEKDSVYIDSSIYKDGKFKLCGNVKYPQRALLRLGQNDPLFFEDAVKFTNEAMFVFLEEGDIQIKTNKTLREARLSGTPSNEDLQVYTDSIRFYRDWLDGYRERYKMAYCNRDEAAFVSLSKENQCMEQRLKNVEINFFESHPKSLFALDWLTISYNIVREKI